MRDWAHRALQGTDVLLSSFIQLPSKTLVSIANHGGSAVYDVHVRNPRLRRRILAVGDRVPACHFRKHPRQSIRTTDRHYEIHSWWNTAERVFLLQGRTEPDRKAEYWMTT